MLHSIYDLTTFCRRTAGHVPAKLVGASTTVVGSKMYLFGGRLVSERKMVSDLYVFDLRSFKWEKIPPHPEDDIPRPRYFHSADSWDSHLIIFGGMSNQPESQNPDELCVLNDVRFFDLATRRWLPHNPYPSLSVPVSDSLVPRARYAHLSSVTADRLFIIGGQDFHNNWLDDICVYDLLGKTWVQRREYPRHCGTYRSVAVASNMTVRVPQDETSTSQASSTLGVPGQRFTETSNPTQSSGHFTASENLTHLPYSAPPTEEHPSDIYLYSNYNFTDVRRELEVFSPLPDTDFTIHDRSSSMTGTTFPPGLRFPTGAILGTHLIIAGTYLAHSYQSFSIWVLDLQTMTWSRIDPGRAIETGSWFRGCLWAEENKFLIFGNKKGNLVEDYNRRLLSWDHVAVVDLEAFGIYQPPSLKLDIRMQELGLAALEEKVFMDFEIVCDDGRRIPCSRKLLEERWSWFKRQRVEFEKKAKDVLQTLPSSNMHVPLPDLATAGTSATGALSGITNGPLSPEGTSTPADWELVNGVNGIGELMMNGIGHGSSPTLNGTTINGDVSPQHSPIDPHHTISSINGSISSSPPSAISTVPPVPLSLSTSTTAPSSSPPSASVPTHSSTSSSIIDPRLTPRQFHLSEPYPITLALIQYFYTLSLITPLQHAPAVLSQLLVLSTNYDIDHLRELVKHAMHRALSNATSVGVYEITSLCNCRSLQIRALRTIMSYTQRRPGRHRTDSTRHDQGGGGGGGGGGSGGGSNGPNGPPPGPGPSSPGGGSGSMDKYTPRPRGTSDARWRGAGATSGLGGMTMSETQAQGLGYSPVSTSVNANASTTTLGASTINTSMTTLSAGSGSGLSASTSATSLASGGLPSPTSKSSGKGKNSAKQGQGISYIGQSQAQQIPPFYGGPQGSRASAYSPISSVQAQQPHSGQPSPVIPYHDPTAGRPLPAVHMHRPSLAQMNALSSVDEMFEMTSSSGNDGYTDENTDTEDEREREIRASLGIGGAGDYRSRYGHEPADDYRRGYNPGPGYGFGGIPAAPSATSVGSLSRKASNNAFAYDGREYRDESQVLGRPQASQPQVPQAQAQAIRPPPMLRSNSDYTAGTSPHVRQSRSASSAATSVFKPSSSVPKTVQSGPPSPTVMRSPTIPDNKSSTSTNSSGNGSGKKGFKPSIRPIFIVPPPAVPPTAASFLGLDNSTRDSVSSFASASTYNASPSHSRASSTSTTTAYLQHPSTTHSLNDRHHTHISDNNNSTKNAGTEVALNAPGGGVGSGGGGGLGVIHEAAEEREKQTISELTMTRAGLAMTMEEYTSYFDDDEGDETGAEADIDTEAEAELEYNRRSREDRVDEGSTIVRVGDSGGRRGKEDRRPSPSMDHIPVSEWREYLNTNSNMIKDTFSPMTNHRVSASAKAPVVPGPSRTQAAQAHLQQGFAGVGLNSVPTTPPTLSRASSMNTGPSNSTSAMTSRGASGANTPNGKSPRDVEFSMALSAAIKEIGTSTTGQSGSTLSRFLSRRRGRDSQA
ncbi:hypothetical protein AX16_008464 [Volvariella volvacea WC 439]|nr:hypothetical protein AX16_008464 [Volvariella volvacea WC 439]